MQLHSFVAARQGRWERLNTLLDQVERRGIASLAPQQVDELFSLYRLVSSDLNLVQTRTGNPALLEYLESMVGRAYAQLSVPRHARTFPGLLREVVRGWWQILRHHFPGALRAEWRLLLLAAATMLAGALLGLVATAIDPDGAAVVFLPAEHLVQTPAERVAELEAQERSGSSPISNASEHALFTTFLFTHNIRVSVLCFALGLTFGVGTIVVLFFNGAMLGSIAAMYWQDGVFTFFVAWVGPHGSIELPCILFAATAGLILARAQWQRERGRTWQQIRQHRPRLVHLIVGCATLLVVAGTVEGGFSQINEPTLPYPFKITVAAVLFLALLAYLFWMPVRRSEGEPRMNTDGHG